LAEYNGCVFLWFFSSKQGVLLGIYGNFDIGTYLYVDQLRKYYVEEN